MSVLLGQAHGFEGFGSVAVLLDVNNHPLLDRSDGGQRVVDGHTAGALSDEANSRKDATVGKLEELLDFGNDGKRFDEILEVALHGLPTMMRRGIGILNGGPPTYLRVVQPADGIEVAAVECLAPVLRQLLVLLRHRLRSIPQGQESA